MKDYYKILKINFDATLDEIKKAYRKLALEYHPDRNHSSNASSLFIEITEAYEILGNAHKKEAYDTLFFKKDSIETSTIINEWQQQAYQKAYRHSKMDFSSYENILKQELKVLSEHSSNLGCLAFVILGAVLGLVLIIMGLISGEEKQLGAGVTSFVVYLIAVAVFYPKITSQYQNDRKKIKK
jgi:curved DNA-binding protein CbpA